MTIELPIGDYNRDQFGRFCERFGCKLLESKRNQKHLLIVETDDPINFFWLGCNLSFYHNTGVSISAASEIFEPEEEAQYYPPQHFDI